MECCNVEMRIVGYKDAPEAGQLMVVLSYQCPICGQQKAQTVPKE